LTPRERVPLLCVRERAVLLGAVRFYDVEQQLVEAVLLDSDSEETTDKRILFPN
jgi:hypothetical protein